MEPIIIDENTPGIIKQDHGYIFRGDLEAGNLDIRINLTVTGWVKADGWIKALGSIEARDFIEAGDTIEVGGSIKAKNWIEADGSIETGGSIEAGGWIEAGGPIKVGNYIIAGRWIQSGGSKEALKFMTLDYRSRPMNRDIKFRVWDTKYNVIISWDDISESRTLAFLVNNHNRNISNNSILMQFTGLIDRNGKDIYEGDIVECFGYDRTFKAKIIFQDGCFEIQGPQDENGGVFRDYLKYFTCNNAVSVIGNIYKNPNILKQSNQGD